MSDPNFPDRTDDWTGDEFSDEDIAGLLDASITDLLADPAMWEAPSTGLDDKILQAIESEAVIGPATPLERAREARARRQWVRPALLGAAATLMFLFGGLVVAAALSGDDRDVFALELVPTGLVDDVSGDIDVTVLDSGLRIDLDALGLPRRENGRHYAGWLALDDGTIIPVGTFHDGLDVVLWAGIEIERVQGFTITLEETAPGPAPEQASSGQVVLKASFEDAAKR